VITKKWEAQVSFMRYSSSINSRKRATVAADGASRQRQILDRLSAEYAQRVHELLRYRELVKGSVYQIQTRCGNPVSREIDQDGNTEHWVLVTTSSSFSAPHTRSTYALRTSIEERHRQYKCFWDLAQMPSRKFSMVVNQVLFVLLAYTLLQAHLFLSHRQQMNPRTRGRLLQLLNPTVELVAVYYQQRFCLLSLAELAVFLLDLEEAARAKLLPKMKQLQREIYHLLQNARPP
jgi:hypothetical protein